MKMKTVETKVHFIRGDNLEDLILEHLGFEFEAMSTDIVHGGDSDGDVVCDLISPKTDEYEYEIEDLKNGTYYTRQHLEAAIFMLIEKEVLPLGLYIVTYTWG